MKTIPYSDILNQTHTLIAGTTGSGKSVLINGLMCELLNIKPDCKLVLIDLKKVELSEYKNIKQTFSYSDSSISAVNALKSVINIINIRYNYMQHNHIKTFCKEPVYVIIDELADLMTVNKKDILPLLQRIGQIGRAANVHMICATQCPLVTVIPTSLKVNFTAIIGLKTRSKQDSRNILGVTGCEELPQYGYGYYLRPSHDIELFSIPYIQETDISAIVKPLKKSFTERYMVLTIAVCILLKVLITVL